MRPFFILPLLTAILLLKSFMAVLGIWTEGIGLGPDEAQYWTWSQALDWGYYSKPPGIAWQIWAGTKLFGNTELGVRFMAVVLNFSLSFAVYFLARACRLREWTSFWAALCMAFSPLGLLGSILATTDGGLVLFWTLSCLVMARAFSAGEVPNYPLLGVMILVGALFKWPIYIFWIFVFLFWPFYAHLRSKKVLAGIAISLLGLLPSIVWNAQHDWATFRHVMTTVQGGHAAGAGGNFWDFIGAQAALASPILFLLMLAAFATMWRYLLHVWPALLFCGISSFFLLGAYAFLALNQKMQGNWVAFAYPPGFVLLAWYALEHTFKGHAWLKGGLVLSCILFTGGLALPLLHAIPFRMNPFKQNLGWKEMGQGLVEKGYDPEHHFLFGDKYQITSLLSFYGPEQKRAYFINLQGARKNQFSYWPSLPQEQMGNEGYFVLVENSGELPDYHSLLTPYFDVVEFLGAAPLVIQGGNVVKTAAYYRCSGYNGRLPEDLEKY